MESYYIHRVEVRAIRPNLAPPRVMALLLPRLVVKNSSIYAEYFGGQFRLVDLHPNVDVLVTIV